MRLGLGPLLLLGVDEAPGHGPGARPGRGPRVLAELGPGSSLGVGLAAMLSGTRKYWALDVAAYTDTAYNLGIFEALLDMFRRREPVPDDREFPEVKPRLASYAFPADLLTEGHMREALGDDRVAAIRRVLRDLVGRPESRSDDGSHEIRYVVPWHGGDILPDGGADMVLSQAVMEHVEDVEGAYRSLYQWLKPGGIATHQIDFRCHYTARAWNGHWGYSGLTWRLMKGRKPFTINRVPLSRQLAAMRGAGFEIVLARPNRAADGSGIASASSPPSSPTSPTTT